MNAHPRHHLTRREALRGGALGAGALAAGAGAATVVRPAAAASDPSVREYWVAATNRRWQASPTGRDDFHDMKVPKTPFPALAYVATQPGFGRPLPRAGIGDNATMPGPVLRGSPGDTIVVHFRNLDRRDRRPHTMHPHGVHYAPEFDGSYMGRHTPPGGAVPFGETFTYRWDVAEDSVGVWPYHDHGPFEMESTAGGLFGAIVITPRGEPAPDVETTLYFHHLEPDITGADQSLSAINGRAFAGNTPTVRARVGQDVAFNVLTLGNELHTFHIHGHRWKGPAGNNVDSPIFGPSEGLRARFREDAPGRWLYHCHVSAHMHHGMLGYYLVDG